MYLKLHEYERALDILQKLSASGFSESGNVQANIGLALDGMRDMQAAVDQFQQVISLFYFTFWLILFILAVWSIVQHSGVEWPQIISLIGDRTMADILANASVGGID